uniref:Si:dkey-14o18.2 n=1 Tax=Myripristis murdjan TaxID=586833 RepID=A0A668AD87_9TELE
MPLSAGHQQWGGALLGFVFPSLPLYSLLFYSLMSSTTAAGNLPGIEYDYGISPKFVCTPIPPEADPSCYSPPNVPHGPSNNGHSNGPNGSSRRGTMSDEAKATILHLRESLVRQKETILDQRETIRELTAKLTLKGPTYGKHGSFSPEQTGKTLQTLKERLESLQLYFFSPSLFSVKSFDTRCANKSPLHRVLCNSPGNNKKPKSPTAFQIDFPMRTNYMYARMKQPIVNELFGLTVCLWLKGGAGPGLGTPFSYSVPGQANELVLIEWGNNPMELLINDKAVTLPMTLTDGKWHHVCVTWSTRDGNWEAYQDGVKKGSGQNLSAWHPIKPGGTFILGQEQDTMGGRFDATQSFMGDISDLQFWSRVLTANEIYSQASCGGHLTGDVMSWSEDTVELHVCGLAFKHIATVLILERLLICLLLLFL